MLCRNIGIIDAGRIVENTSIKKLLTQLSRETFILDLAEGHKDIAIDGFESRWSDDNTLEVDVEKDAGLNNVFEQYEQARREGLIDEKQGQPPRRVICSYG